MTHSNYTSYFQAWSEQDFDFRLTQGVHNVFRAKNFTELKMQYRTLRSLWHPDHKKVSDERKANEIFQKLQTAFESAQLLLDKGEAVGIKEVLFQNSTSSLFVSYVRKEDFELGQIYTGKNHITYVVQKSYEILFNRAVSNIEKIKYHNDTMKSQFSKTVPEISKIFKTSSGDCVLVVKKNTNLLSLSHVAQHLSTMEAKHVAWIVSNLYNISCFLEYNCLTHNAFLKENIYINPQTHEVALLGGWWYSSFCEDKLLALNAQANSLCSLSAKKEKKPDALLDQKLIAQTAMDLLGSRVPHVLLQNKNNPAPLVNWIASSGSLPGMKNYALWQKNILIESFGKRRFVVLDIKAADIYSDYDALS